MSNQDGKVDSIQPQVVPTSLKIAYTAFVTVLVPVYAQQYGPTNVLWFSDIARLVTVMALWLENRLLIGMMIVGVLIPELQ